MIDSSSEDSTKKLINIRIFDLKRGVKVTYRRVLGDLCAQKV
jgi:hypothetical protein